MGTTETTGVSSRMQGNGKVGGGGGGSYRDVEHEHPVEDGMDEEGHDDGGLSQLEPRDAQLGQAEQEGEVDGDPLEEEPEGLGVVLNQQEPVVQAPGQQGGVDGAHVEALARRVDGRQRDQRAARRGSNRAAAAAAAGLLRGEREGEGRLARRRAARGRGRRCGMGGGWRCRGGCWGAPGFLSRRGRGLGIGPGPWSRRPTHGITDLESGDVVS